MIDRLLCFVCKLRGHDWKPLHLRTEWRMCHRCGKHEAASRD